MISCNNNGMQHYFGSFRSIKIFLSILMAPLFLLAADNNVSEGTRITLQLNETLSTKSNAEGDAFTAVVTMPVYLGGRIVIPKGSVVNGSISRILRPGRLKGKAILDLIFQSIKIPGHRQMDILATLVRIDSEGNRGVRSEGRVEGESSVGSDMGKVIAPSLAGAGIGTLAGGGKGAGIGAGIGAVTGLASIFTSRGKDLEIHRGSTLDIKLDRPLIIPADSNDSTLK
jgi:type IV secretion system protein VirB10